MPVWSSTARALVSLCEALLGPGGERVMNSAARGAFTGEPDPKVWALVEREIKSVPSYVAVALLWHHSPKLGKAVL
jgi:hypothetical protein